MESRRLTDEMLFRQVKSAIAGHNFKSARKILESHLDEVQDNPRIWELYGNVLKKLGKVDKARTAFLRRDELRRDDFIFEMLADENVEDEDLDYLSSQQQAFTHEHYVYGMEEDLSSSRRAQSVRPNSNLGSVLSRKNTHTETTTCDSDEPLSTPVVDIQAIVEFSDDRLVDPVQLGAKSRTENVNIRSSSAETDWLDKPLLKSDEDSEQRDGGPSNSATIKAESAQSDVVPSYYDALAHDSEEPYDPKGAIEPITDVDELFEEELISVGSKSSGAWEDSLEPSIHSDDFDSDWLLAERSQSHDDDLLDFAAVETESSQPELSLFSDDVYAFDPDELIDSGDLEDDSLTAGERISIEQRAERLAAVFIHKHDWPSNTLDLLTHIFAVKVYGPVVKFLNHYAELGMQPEELRFAYTLREIWHQLPKYWLSFYRNGDSAASYCNFSWSQSLRFVALIARRLHGALDEDILVENLDRMYEKWFSSRLLRASYKSFSKYLNATMDQIEEDEVLIENEAGFGCLGDSRELAYSDLGETDLFGYQLAEELGSYGYSYDRSTYRSMRLCEEVIYDAAFYNQHRLQLADASNKDENDD
jgi:hypothetical protein